MLLGRRGVDVHARAEKSRAIKAWVAAALGLEEDATIVVSELSCTEPGCPPLETVIAVRDRGQRREWKLHVPLAEVTIEAVAKIAQAPARPLDGEGA
jgi:hypothetical protein